jgi:hypothetical protein
MRVSEYFNLDRTQPFLDFVDVRIDTDIPVFLDPTSIREMDSDWGHQFSTPLQSFFQTVLKHIKQGNDQEAQQLLASLNERNEFHLGYSKGVSRGHAFGSISATSIWNALTNSKASKTGLLQDLEDACLLIEGIGADMISDAVCNIIREPLLAYTREICQYYGIPMQQNVASGPIWNIHKEKWENRFVELPITPYGKLVLIPKIMVRYRVSYKYDEYYRHYLLPEMQHDEIQKGSSLVDILRDGTKRVTKKSLIGKYGFTKESVVQQTLKYPHVLEEYRQEKKSSKSIPMEHSDFSEIESTEIPNWEALASDLKKIKVGKEEATTYENQIEKILTALFYPSLCSPQKQFPIHNGRKRIDIRYRNEAKDGFFYWLAQHYPSAMVFIECKNYTDDVSNPEIDQISGRFSPSRGMVGLLICRKITNKPLLKSRCIDTAKDRRGFILALDDDDICALLDEKIESPKSQQFELLQSIFSELIT